MQGDDPLKNRVYYSQNREDLILEAFFPDIEKGFYVDVGASDPVTYSVTKLFYEKGWRGINVEPIKHHFASLEAERPEDTNLNIGIGEKKATLTFHEYTGGDGLSTFSSEMADEYSHQEDFQFKDSKEYKVSVKPLRDVFAEQKVKEIHFLKVDVEGFEYDVLAGNDWNKYRPEVICIEANHITKDWRPLLKENAYKLAFSDGLNDYYVDSKTKRQSKFDFVNSVVINRDGGIRISDYDIIAEQRRAIRETHLRLQEALRVNAHQSVLYQDLLAENHTNHTRAAVAERALKRPAAFGKYHLKRGHRLILKKLNEAPVSEYIKDEQKNLGRAVSELQEAKSDTQLLEGAKAVSELETNRLKRIRQSGKRQKPALKAYTRLTSGVKRLRLKGIIK